jgi:hypothetical protein
MDRRDSPADASERQLDARYVDQPRSIAALFESEAAGVDALEKLHDAGFKQAWLGVTRALTDDGAFSQVVRERGGGRLEAFVRLLSGDGGETLYAALTDHGVADDVARRLQRDMPAHGVVVVAGWTGDIADAARVMENAGGKLVRGEDGGVIGSPRLRRPADGGAPA